MLKIGATKQWFGLACFIFLVSFLAGWITFASSPTPLFTFNPASGAERLFNVEDGDTVIATAQIVNVDPDQWIEIGLEVDNRGPMDINFITDPPEVIPPLGSVNMDFELTVPEGNCSDTYVVALRAVLLDYEDENLNSGAGMNAAIGYKIALDVSGDGICLGDGQRQVFHDVDGDGVQEEGDENITNGYAYLYDSSDTLIQTTDLSTTDGIFETPTSDIEGTEDFYLLVNTQNYDGDDLDTEWYENVFVARSGSYSSLGSAIFFDDVSSYSEVLAGVPMRSRNTDQSGDWDGGTLAIGPDDKDQIISPIRWNYLVDETEFKYADLDYDGRIDPDDKDHIISPLYWDFPN